MSTLKTIGQSGFTMIEVTVTLALTAVLGLSISGVMNYANRQTKIQTEDIQSLIIRYGASKVLVRDIANAAPSFNYINFKDDDNLPFFIYSQGELCTPTTCSRKFTMSIAAGATKSRPLFLLTVKGGIEEMIRFGVNPINAFDGTTNAFIGVNPSPTSTTGISKTVIPSSPWEKGRIVLLQTTNSFFDCSSMVNNSTPSGSCTITCQGACLDYAASRQMKMIGVVDNDEEDMTYTSVVGQPALFKKDYSICRPDSATCPIKVSVPNLNSAKKLFENMPYIPGSDNLATITPVGLVRYHLERPNVNSPDNQIVLVRSEATLVGTKLSFVRAHVLMTGIQSIVFTRKNVSNPTIEYKFTKVRYQSAIK
jgi:prepilin-type N-terminal cleavage/methylation domain-containing protein